MKNLTAKNSKNAKTKRAMISKRKVRPDARTIKILKALRQARKEAIKSARMHGVPIVYMKNGKLIRERV